MTVNQLIEELKKYPPNAIACISHRESYMNIERICPMILNEGTIDEFNVALIEYEHEEW